MPFKVEEMTWTQQEPTPHDAESFKAAVKKADEFLKKFHEEEGIEILAAFAAPMKGEPDRACTAGAVMCHPKFIETILSSIFNAISAMQEASTVNHAQRN